jgi:hypothetical protein
VEELNDADEKKHMIESLSPYMGEMFISAKDCEERMKRAKK